MTVADYPEFCAALCEACHLFGERNWCLATGGNFSIRIDRTHFLITQSGKDKSRLSSDDLMVCDIDGNALDTTLRPSAETPLHAYLYRKDENIAAVLHTHSVSATVVSRAVGTDLALAGFEMQKALRGITTHNTSINIPVLENSSDMTELTGQLKERFENARYQLPGFLVRGHGVYAWGESLDEARRHLEGIEFLIECYFQENMR